MIDQSIYRGRRQAFLLKQIKHHPGVQVAHRVPITRPPAGVNPMVVSRLRPASMAARLAPFPR